jgi:hypothetical protein
VKTGAFNTVHVGQTITVESTAEGRAGGFYDMVKRAGMADRNAALTALDFKFHFYPWWTDDGYVLDGDVTETSEMTSISKSSSSRASTSARAAARLVHQEGGAAGRQDAPGVPLHA